MIPYWGHGKLAVAANPMSERLSKEDEQLGQLYTSKITCQLSGTTFMQYAKEIIPFFLAIIAVAIFMIFIPQIVTYIPNLLLGN